ncbi:unnamed protein product [Adineta ricciae]|uniref:G-protein coupled receptors family 1 profile domain-containing protein n=1 Tax=Adineta ricciae TaxID=249248 RepID=A0A813SRE7_ADIRI|nr:unnamed protein product [Adineta ricciae]CAF0812648.1 unnamed protein product [Adineta ricciae]
MTYNDTTQFLEAYSSYPLTYLTFADLYTYEAIILIIYGIMIVFSFFTNFIAMIIFLFGRRSRSDLSPFLLNLSVFNIIMTAYCIPFTITSVIFQRWLYARELCIVLDLFKTFSVTGVLVTLIIIAIDRYCAVRYPLTMKIYSGSKRNVIALTIIWILSIALAIIKSPARSNPVEEKRLWVTSRTSLASFINYLKINGTYLSDTSSIRLDFQYKIVDTIQCVPNKGAPPVEVQRTIFNFLQTYFVPLSVIAFVYLRIAAMLWHRSTDVAGEMNGSVANSILNTHESVQFKKKLKQGLKMLVAVVILYAVLWLPMNVFQLCVNLLCDQGTPYQNFCSRGTLLQLLYIACHFLTVSNTAINPIIYGFANNRFRSDIQQIKHHLLGCQGGTPICCRSEFSRTSSYQLEDRLRDSKMNQNLLAKQRRSSNTRLDSLIEGKPFRTANTNMTQLKEQIGTS